MRVVVRVVGLLGSAVLLACTPELTTTDVAELMEMEMSPDVLPASPTNSVADDAQAAALGRLLFFDDRMSSDGTISCASCHDPDEGFSDPKPVSLGVMELEGERHSMPIPTAAIHRFVLWDGRADSLWSQALKALENEREMDFSRAEVAHFVARNFAQEYEDVFGAMPNLEEVPDRAAPGSSEWEQLTSSQQTVVNEIFSNVGKLIEAYERRIMCDDTRFDRWARGEVVMTGAEETGAAVFVSEGCINCHSGPAFTDGLFHNIGIGSGSDVPDRGRAGAFELLAADEFSGSGPYSDNPTFGVAKLETMTSEGALGAFRTPTLRGVAQRQFFGHRGHREELGDFIGEVYDGPSLEDSAVGELDPLVRGLDVGNTGDVVAFLRMLDCPPLPPELSRPAAPGDR